MTFRLHPVLLAGIAALAAATAARADYPERPIEVIVPFDPGGGADTSMRTFGKYAEKLAGQPVVVVNKPGGGGTIGWAEFVRATPDGYVLTLETPPFNVIPVLTKPSATGYKLDQFQHICIFAAVPDVLLVREDSPHKTLQDLLDHAKANPEKVKAANTGTLGADFMTTLLIEDKAGVKFTQVPFTGGSQALQGTLAGTTDMMVAGAIFAVAQKGKMRTLAIAAAERDPTIPDVPTFQELGIDIVSERYRALAAPPGTAPEVMSYWTDVCAKVSENADYQKEMHEGGAPPVFHDSARSAELIGAMTKEMQALVEKFNLAK
ncbi:tripartite tricarboxylate transporter substrate binding protein [Arvimicrobium flavum]|uniref:tripartite tricarboxylate transporter substrate binding protein n=1 Tax=Arvimicrobium flavum TaxID=3393320 RepID=UPI00237A55C0|nr:tripartite tricarboxylate transporter substrate binding protein [Mesorhizobium shangrilense]